MSLGTGPLLGQAQNVLDKPALGTGPLLGQARSWDRPTLGTSPGCMTIFFILLMFEFPCRCFCVLTEPQGRCLWGQMSPGDKPPQRPVFSLAEARSSIQALENLADIACRCTSPFRIVTEDSPSTTSPARLRISPALETAQFSGLRHSCNALPRSFVCRSCKRLLEYAGHTPSRIRWSCIFLCNFRWSDIAGAISEILLLTSALISEILLSFSPPPETDFRVQGGSPSSGNGFSFPS